MAEIIKPPHDHGEHENDQPVRNEQVAWERRDVGPGQITGFAIGLFISFIIVVFIIIGIFDFLRSREDAKNPKNMPAMMQEMHTMKPPEPRLQANPKMEIKDLRDSEAGILENYGWLNPDKGIVRIPIEKAIEMTAAKGLPSKPTPAGTANGGYRTIPEDSSGGRTLEKIAQ